MNNNNKNNNTNNKKKNIKFILLIVFSLLFVFLGFACSFNNKNNNNNNNSIGLSRAINQPALDERNNGYFELYGIDLRAYEDNGDIDLSMTSDVYSQVLNKPLLFTNNLSNYYGVFRCQAGLYNSDSGSGISLIYELVSIDSTSLTYNRDLVFYINYELLPSSTTNELYFKVVENSAKISQFYSLYFTNTIDNYFGQTNINCGDSALAFFQNDTESATTFDDLYYTPTSLVNNYIDTTYAITSSSISNVNYQYGYNQATNDILNNPNSYGLYSQSQFESNYNLGFTNGQLDSDLSENGFIVLFNLILNAPFNILNGMLNFEIFGVNLFSLFSVIFTLGIIIWFFKHLKG